VKEKKSARNGKSRSDCGDGKCRRIGEQFVESEKSCCMSEILLSVQCKVIH